MLGVLPALVAVGLFVYSLVECLQSHPHDVRTLPRPAWLLVILLPLVGPLLWLLAGRPQQRARHSRAPRAVGRPTFDDAPPLPDDAARGYPIGPDDDPEFMAQLRREQERRRHTERPKEADDS